MTSLATWGSTLGKDLTRKRVRTHAVILGVLFWVMYAFNLATPGPVDRFGNLKGGDFLHFYVLGKIALSHSGGLLYNATQQNALAGQFAPATDSDFYLPVYGPQFSLVFAPFAALTYGWAALSWILVSVLICGVCCFFVGRTCTYVRADYSTVLILILAFPGFFSLVSGGQNSALALGAFTAAFFALRAERPLLAGLAIGLLAYKPQFGLMAAIVFIVTLEWKVILGASITIVAQFAAAWWYYGPNVLRDYWHNIGRIREYTVYLEPHLYKMPSLRGFWLLLCPWPQISLLLYLASALAIAFVTVRCWKSENPLPMRFTVFLLGTVLIDPHLTDYDLVVLLPAIPLVGDRILRTPPSEYRDSIKLWSYAAYGLPVLSSVLRFTHVQFSTIAMTSLLLLLAATANYISSASSRSSSQLVNL